MNRKKSPYDRYAVGERIQKQRQSLGLSQEQLAERIDRAAKYCSDIERGICGMSVETMLAFSESLHMSLDYMMYGIAPDSQEKQVPVERTGLQQMLADCTDRQYNYALRLMEVFLTATEEN
ncbi:MAG: helix-turn-helix transcriptional regulator [Lachnospiraceae bacterium]|nr:helix-turn-helix transcriptional regulator [Lachnospiraceae bacterium]